MSTVLKSVPVPTGHLRVRTGAEPGRNLPLVADIQVIGAAEECDLRLEGTGIAQRHAEIRRRDRRHFIRDLDSGFGTTINARRIDGEVQLREGDLVQIGYAILEYVTGPPEHERPREAEPVVPEPAHVPRELMVRAVQVGLQLPPPIEVSRFPGYELPGQRPPRPPERDRDDELSLRGLLLQSRRVIRVFLPYYRSILALTLIGLIGGVLSYFLLPPARTAVFEISLIPAPAENPVQRFERSNVTFFRSAQQNFRSPTLIRNTLIALGEPDPSPGELSSIQSRLTFDAIFSNTYRGTYSSKGAADAVSFLEKHVHLYLDTEIEKTLKVIRAEADFLQKQLADTEEALQTTEAELLRFKQENIDGLPDQARQYYDLLFELQKRQSEVDKEIGRIRSLHQVDRGKLDVAEPLVQSRVLETRPYQSAIVDINRQIAEARASGMDEEHPEVQRLNAQAEELRRLAASGDGGETESERRRNPAYEALQDNLRQLEVAERTAIGESARIKRDLERVKAVVDKLPRLEADYSGLMRSYDATKDLHTRIFQQLKTTELQLELERASAVARYDIITPPALEFTSPVVGVLRRAVLLSFVGFALGLLFAALRQLKGYLDGH